MRIAIAKDAHIVLVVIFLVSGLLLMEFILLPWYLNSAYRDDFRANSPESFASFFRFARAYEKPKVYFIGDSVFWGNGLNKSQTLAAYFEDCDDQKREAFNFALTGNIAGDQLQILESLDDGGLVVFEINPFSITPGIKRLYSINLDGARKFPRLYTERYAIQYAAFGRSGKEYVEILLTEKNITPVNVVTPNFDAPRFEFHPDVVANISKIASSRVLFLYLPIYNRSYSLALFPNGRHLELSMLNLSREYYLDFNHLSPRGNQLLAEKLCEVL